jgi:transcription initiation factor TFIIB
LKTSIYSFSILFLNERMLQKTSSPYGSKLIDKCPECGSIKLIHDYDTGETVCGDCGLVLYEQMIDKGPEWRAFTHEEKTQKSRVGAPTTYTVHDKGLSTAISQANRDAYGHRLKPPRSDPGQIYRLRKWQKRSRIHDSVDRNRAEAMSELDRLSDKLYIPSPIKEKAALIYRKAQDKGLLRGRSIAALATAALYAACRGSGNPRTLREIAKASLVSKKDVARAYRLLIRNLDVQMPVAGPLKYLSKIASTVGISGKAQGIAVQIIWEAKKKRQTGGKDPVGLAAAALYIGCLQNGEKKTQKEIAEAAGVTEVTIRNRYKTLKKELGLDLPD